MGKTTGTGRGGKRLGAGRPRGAVGVLPLGTVQAIKAANFRVPKDAAPEIAALANRALQRIVDVMEGKLFYQQAASVLKASTTLREEVCGPVAQKVQHTGADGGSLVIQINKLPPEEG